MKSFLTTRTELLNENGCHLHEQVRYLVQLYEEISAMNIAPHDKNDNKNYNTIADIDSPDLLY